MAKKKKAAPQKAAPVKKAAPAKKAAKKAAPKKKGLQQAKAPQALLADGATAGTSMSIDVEFRDGVGDAIIKLFRNGKQIDRKDIDRTGTVTFNDVQTGDSISLGGNAPKTKFVFSRSVDPASPRSFTGPINELLDVL